MTITLIVASALVLAVILMARCPRDIQVNQSAPARPARRRSDAAAPARAAASAAKSPAPILQLLEWNEAPKPIALGAAEARVRDLYIAARFPGVLRGSADLAKLTRVIEAARHDFEDGQYERAHEVLQLAIEASPLEPSLRLAQIEIAFLKRDRTRFLEGARDVRVALPGLAEWKEVQTLGCALAPEDKLFGAKPANPGNEHFGRWPGTPNWLVVSGDAAAVVRAADFNRAMSRASAHAAAPIRAAA